MAITFLEKRKKQRYLILVLIVVLLITAIVIWWGFFREPAPPSPPEEILKLPLKVEIDFEVLKSLILEELQFFEEISPWQEEVGRENPFIPY